MHTSAGPNNEEQKDKPRSFYAFLSYSHRDTKIVKRLHRELEQYRVPPRLAGKESPVVGVIPQRLFPIFLDREELPSSANLGTAIEEALNFSSTLIAVCSPHAAASRWVNGEVEHFKRQGRSERVIALVVDGEPNATDNPDLGKPECFCPALRFRMGEDGKLSQQRVEPLAADIRADRDGWEASKLKLIAGILGIPYDDLRQREREHSRKKAMRNGVVALIALVAACLGGLWVNEKYHQIESTGYAKRAQVEISQQRYLSAAVYAEASARVRPENPDLLLLLPVLARAFPTGVATLQSKARTLEHVAFAPDGRQVYAAGNDGKLYHWNLDQPSAQPSVYPITSNGRALSRLVYRRPAGPLIVAAWDASVTLWDPKTSSITHRIAAHLKRTRITGLALDPSEPRFATAGDDGYVKLWSQSGLPAWTAGGLPLENVAGAQVAEHDDLAKCVAISPDSTRIASGGFDDQLRLQNSDGTSPTIIPANDSLNAILFSPDGRWVLTAGRSKKVTAYNAAGGVTTPVWTLEGAHANRINDLALMPDGHAFVTASDDGSIRVWSLADRRLLLTIEHESTVPSLGKKDEVKFLGVAVSDDGSLIAGSQSDGKVSVWSSTAAKPATFADLQPLLDQRVSVRWDRGSLVTRSSAASQR